MDWLTDGDTTADWLLRGSLAIIVVFILVMTWATFFGPDARRK